MPQRKGNNRPSINVTAIHPAPAVPKIYAQYFTLHLLPTISATRHNRQRNSQAFQTMPMSAFHHISDLLWWLKLLTFSQVREGQCPGLHFYAGRGQSVKGVDLTPLNNFARLQCIACSYARRTASSFTQDVGSQSNVTIRYFLRISHSYSQMPRNKALDDFAVSLIDILPRLKAGDS